MARTAVCVLVAIVAASFNGHRSAAQDTLFETTLVGVVVPDEVQPGDTVTGTVTLDPLKYEGIPGLRVITAEIPAAPTGTLSGTIIEIGTPSTDPQRSGQLSGVIIDIPKDKEEQKKRSNIGKIVLKAAEVGANQLPLLFRRQGQPIATRNIPLEAAGQAPPLETFEVPSVIGSNDIPVISGPIGQNPQVSIGEVPTEVIASGPRSAAFEVPPNVVEGSQAVTLRDQPARTLTDTPTQPSTSATPPTTPSTPMTPTTPAKPTPAESRSVVFDDVTVVGIGLKADGPTKVVSRGTETPFVAAITGKVPPTLLETRLPKGSRYLTRIPYRALAGAPKPGDRGKIGILIENRSPGIIRLDGERDGAIVKWFNANEIANGNVSVKSKIIARRVGAYNVRARVMPMLPPAVGRPQNSTSSTAR